MTGEDVEPGDETYFTSGQAARMLHVSAKTLDRWADCGRIAHVVTLGGHRRFSRAAIAAVQEEMERRRDEEEPGGEDD
ncbi:MAG: helix-turn-helix domain-containing protein [Actinomycetota bacterium]|nr:helix-turn-helix domain-containing protein [Actinomycetota bacterium]